MFKGMIILRGFDDVESTDNFIGRNIKNQTLNREFEPIKSVSLPEEEIRNYHKSPQVDKKEIRKRNIQKEKQRNLSNRTNEINSFSKRNSNKETMDVKIKVVKTQKTSPGFQNVFEKSTKQEAGKNRKSRKRKNQKRLLGSSVLHKLLVLVGYIYLMEVKKIRG